LGRKGYLSGNQVLDMAAAGMAIGSHGMHHRRWVGLSASQLDEEIGSAKKVLEKIVVGEVDAAACPFGAYDRRVLRTLRTAGFRRIYTSDGAPAIPEALIQPRHTIRRGHTLEDVQRVVSTKPAGWFRIWTALKLGIKRWR
jgi:peptidoglycan/xylan/chitin deacetylase (PgdA/CDA1 family)